MIVAVVLTALGVSLNSTSNASYTLKAHYSTANGLILNSDVYLGGVKVGVVSGLDVDKDGRGITVTASIDPKYSPYHEGATMHIRPKSLLGEKYLFTTIGDPSKDALPNGTALPDSATQVNVELDQLINTFDEPTRKQLQVLINQLGAGVAGQGRMLNETFQSGRQDLAGLASVTDTLQQRDTELKTVIESLQKLMATLSTDQQRKTYVDLLAHSDQVLKTLLDEDANVRQGIDRMNQFFGEIDAGFAGRTEDLQAIVHNLPGTLSALDALSVNLGTKGHRSLPTVYNVLPGLIEGNLIFGSQLDAANGQKAFTGNVFTRVMPSQGCFYVDSRTNPTGDKVVDTGNVQTTVCTAPAGVLGCLGAIQSGNPGSIVAACSPANLAPICSSPELGQIPGIALVCSTLPHSASHALVPGGTGALPSSIASNLAALTPSAPTNVSDQVHQDLLRYLLQ
jgi:virulence factor Mce-like protein